MFRKKLKVAAVSLILFFLAFLMSCTKSNKTSENDASNQETVAIAENDFAEKDEDLLNVDYKEFYDELSPYGEWIEVTDKDIDLDLKKTSAAGEKSHRSISVSQLFGIKDAYADDVAFGAFFVWRPSPNLAVSIVAGEPEPYYIPYANGQWVYSDAGWYFAAPTYHEEIVHHYGRWVFSPALGWIWVPGRVWAPAWVEWRIGYGYVAWEPLPPSIYIVNNYIIAPPVYEERFIIVENRYFCEPYVYKYKYKYKGHGNMIMIKDMTRVNGVMIRDNMVINQGPDISMIEKDRDSKIEKLKLSKVKDKSDSKFDGKEIKSYSPDFKKVSSGKDRKSSITKPGKFESFSDAKNRSGKNDQLTQKGNNGGDTKDNYSKGNDKGSGKTDGNYGKDNRSGRKDNGNNRKNDYNKNSDFGKQKDVDGKRNNRKSDGNNDKKIRKNDGGNRDKGQNKSGNYDKGKNNSGNNDKGQNKGGNERKKFNKKQSQKNYDGKSNDRGKNNFNYRNETKSGQNQDNNSRNMKKFSKEKSKGELKQEKGNNQKSQKVRDSNTSNKRDFGNKKGRR